jgi:hypothetical protein
MRNGLGALLSLWQKVIQENTNLETWIDPFSQVPCPD